MVLFFSLIPGALNPNLEPIASFVMPHPTQAVVGETQGALTCLQNICASRLFFPFPLGLCSCWCLSGSSEKASSTRELVRHFLPMHILRFLCLNQSNSSAAVVGECLPVFSIMSTHMIYPFEINNIEISIMLRGLTQWEWRGAQSLLFLEYRLMFLLTTSVPLFFLCCFLFSHCFPSIV